jgi:hypothetical protein
MDREDSVVASRDQDARPQGQSGVAATPSEGSISSADRACLTAAKSTGLLRKNAGSLMCPGSAMPSIGWWARSTWTEHDTDPGKGGPWSVERVFRLCEMGLLGVWEREESRARLTKSGAALISAARKKASQTRQPGEREAEGEPQQNSAEPQP